MNELYRRFLDQDKADKAFSMQCTVVAAEHPYSCKCPSCYVHWVHIYGPVELEDSEFGYFGRTVLEEGRRYLGLPIPVEGVCVDCGVQAYGWENEPVYCEEHWHEHNDEVETPEI